MSSINHQEQTLQFIEDYKSHPELWKTNIKSYNNKQKKHKALNYLCKKYNLNPIACRNKIKSLRSYFCKEYQRTLSQQNSSSASEDEYISSWFAYEPLLFLTNDPKFGARVEVSLCQFEEESAEESDEKSIKDAEECKESIRKLQNPEKKMKKIKDRNSLNRKTKKAYNSLKKVVEIIQKRDDLTIFGEHVASQIRNINDKRRQCIAQHNINNILFQLSMENYSSAQSPDSLTPSSSSGVLSSQYQSSMEQCANQQSGNLNQSVTPSTSQFIEFSKF